MFRIIVVLLSVSLVACAGQPVGSGLNSALGTQNAIVQSGQKNNAENSVPRSLLFCFKELTSGIQGENAPTQSLLAHLIRANAPQNTVPTTQQVAVGAEALEVAEYVRALQARATALNRPAISLHLENKANDRLCLEQQAAYWQKIVKSEQNRNIDTPPEPSRARQNVRMLTTSLATLNRIYSETSETVQHSHPQEVSERLTRSFQDKTLYLPASVL